MPAMSKISAGAAGAALMTTAFVAPGSSRQALRGPAVQGQRSTGAGAYSTLGAAGVCGLVAMSMGRPTRPRLEGPQSSLTGAWPCVPTMPPRWEHVAPVMGVGQEIGACDPLLFWDPIGA